MRYYDTEYALLVLLHLPEATVRLYGEASLGRSSETFSTT
jgi:hypothetical protein